MSFTWIREAQNANMRIEWTLDCTDLDRVPLSGRPLLDASWTTSSKDGT